VTTIATHHDESHEGHEYTLISIESPPDDHVRLEEDHVLLEAAVPFAPVADLPAHADDTVAGVSTRHPVSHEEPTSGGAVPTMTGNGLDTHVPAHAPQPANVASASPTDGSVSGPAAAEARGLLEGIAESLRTLAGRQGTDGAAVAIFPRGVDLLEVRMHVSRDQAIDLNFRVAGPAQPNLSV
jgi:hypothetical protein